MNHNGNHDGPPLPGNPLIEEAVLGSILIDSGWLPELSGALNPADFSVTRFGVIYEAMQAMERAGTRVDLTTLVDYLERCGKLATVGGASYLTSLINAPETSTHARYYAGIVRHDSIRRALIAAAGEIAKSAYANLDAAEMVAQAQNGIAQVRHMLGQADAGLSLKDSLAYYLDLLGKREADKDKPKLAFPWRGLAGLMPHLDAGTLVGIVAEAGVGKTSFLENCTERWAASGWRVAFFHFELSTHMMLDRRMQRASGVPIQRLQLGGQLESEDYDRIVAAAERMDRWPGNIHYVHCPGWTMAQVIAAAEQLHDEAGLEVVIVDYLNKIELRDRGGGMNTAQMRGADIEQFKVALERHGWVGLMAAQFNVAGKHAQVRTLADVRDTGELDDKANVGIVLDRPRDNQGDRSGETKVRVVKCNAGQEGSVDLWFNGSRLSFDLMHYEEATQ